ncbi:Uncharacterised protein [Mycobacteroides abscessus subsp. abscessus]|nr:Uncharacterised protein [Mycobacteroides abscessus subsp. abscessus]
MRHGGIPSSEAAAYAFCLMGPTRAMVWTASASASASSTCGTPRCIAQRSASVEPAMSPVTALSAISNPDTSARPEWYRRTAAPSTLPSVSETNCEQAAANSRMSEPTASITMATTSASTFCPRRRNSLCTKSARSAALVMRAQLWTEAPRFCSVVANAFARPPPECWTSRKVPGGRSVAACSMRVTASLPASAAASMTMTLSSANNDGLSNSASSATST